METTLETHIEAQVLRLEIDLGGLPPLWQYAQQVDALEKLVQFSVATVTRFTTSQLELLREEHQPSVIFRELHNGIRVVRTSMASPWITILGELASRSSPVGYSLTGIYCLQKLLRMIMDWQRHRADLERYRISGGHKDDAPPPLADAENVMQEFLAQVRRDAARAGFLFEDPVSDGEGIVRQAVASLGSINSVELLDESGPDATGPR